MQYFRLSLSCHLSLRHFLFIFEWPLKTGFTVDVTESVFGVKALFLFVVVIDVVVAPVGVRGRSCLVLIKAAYSVTMNIFRKNLFSF